MNTGKLVRRLLQVALSAVFVAAMDNASAGPISSYDAQLTADLTITATATDVMYVNANGSLAATRTGDGQTDPGAFVETNLLPPPTLSMFLHVFGSGTGSSEQSGVVSIDIVGTLETYEIDVTFITDSSNSSGSSTPPGTDMTEIMGPDLELPDATPLASCPTGVTECFDARGTVTATLSGDVSGSVFTPTTVPEPATLALFGIGLAGLGFSRRKC